VRQRLQAAFDHARRCVDKGEHDYAHDLLTQCVSDDPGNLIYLQRFLANLAEKYGNNKKGARLAGLKIKSGRMTLNKAAGKGQWREAFHAACDALKYNPWDTATLIALADACAQIGSHEAEIYLLRWAMEVDHHDVTVNRRAAEAFARLGQFDQAIACWRRVEQQKPGDQEASRSIAQLSVEQTIKKGGYNEELLRGDSDLSDLESAVRSSMARGRRATADSAALETVDTSREQSLLATIDAQPADVGSYLELAKIFAVQRRLREAEQVLTKALAVTGGGDLVVREQLEEMQLQRVREQVEIAHQRAAQQKDDDAQELARRMAVQANQVELEVYAARAARDPGNLLVQYELGLRLKRAGKYKDAIQAFQNARDDARHRAMVQVHLGESFQHLRQFKLALASYETAIESADTVQLDVKKLALYRAAVLAAEFRDVDRAERFFTQLAAIDFGYRDVADRLDKLAALRDSG
jgi:tetratricopeptide (TPR) repeat protein